MKNIIKILLTFIVVTIIVTSCGVEDYSLGSTYSITEDKVTFSMTKGSDEYNYTYTASVDVDAVKYPYTVEIRFGDLFSGTDLYATKGEQVTKNLTGTFEYIVPAGKYTARFLVYTPNGNVVIKDKEIVIAVDNEKLYLDDPASLQFALTGGKANIDGKEWQLGAWTAMRNPDNRNDVWWDFKDPAIMDDIFTFKPNGTQPNGDFVHENNGDSFMNESLGNLFPDGDPDGSFVTVNYFPPTDAKWEVTKEGDKHFLTIKKGFFGYASQPADLVETTYEVVEFSPTSIKLILASGWDGWCYELSSEVPYDDLTGFGSKTWVVDSNNKHLQEVKDALPEIAGKLKGHMGLGPLDGGYQEWWGADPGNKSEENVGWTLYDCKYTFSTGALVIETKGEGYGRKACADIGGFTPTSFQGDDMLFPYNGGNYTYTRTADEMTISDNGYLVYYAGEQTYDFVYLSETALCVRVKNTTEGQDWVFILCPEGEQ